MKNQTSFKGIVLLLLTAFIWGISFVAQSEGMESVDAFTFQAIRTLMGSAILVPFILIRNKKNAKEKKYGDKRIWLYGSILGILLAAASNFQQFAFYHSSAGKIAFITATYMFFVPIIGLFLHKKIPVLTWICIAMGFIGLYFLCISSGGISDINRGDLQAFVCALFFAGQIILIDNFAKKCDEIKLSCIQFLVSGTISLVLMFIFEKPEPSAIKSAIIPLLYSGVLSCGVAYTLQIVGQKYCEPTLASLLMCMESVFACLASAILLNEKLSAREIFGCIIMFTAILIPQISDMKKNQKTVKK